MRLLITGEMTVIHDHERSCSYSGHFLQGTLWAIKQRVDAARQQRRVQQIRPAVAGRPPDPWSSGSLAWDVVGVHSWKSMKPRIICEKDMHRAPGKSSTEADTMFARSDKASWFIDTRATAIEAWYQELRHLYHTKDFTGMGLHLEDLYPRWSHSPLPIRS